MQARRKNYKFVRLRDQTKTCIYNELNFTASRQSNLFLPDFSTALSYLSNQTLKSKHNDSIHGFSALQDPFPVMLIFVSLYPPIQPNSAPLSHSQLLQVQSEAAILQAAPHLNVQ